jgi:hypothetical protein
MKMRLLRHIYFVLIPAIVMSTALITSCDENGDGMNIEEPNGPPVINYIRLADPDKSDSLIVSADLGTGIVLMGENLGGTREVWFNDRQSPALTPTWVTNTTVFVSVPQAAPDVVTNIMYVVDANGNTLEYPFVVSISAPAIYGAVNEWPQAGENLVIVGDYFFEPMTVTFSGNVTGEIVSVSQNKVEVAVPAGAVEGPVHIKTNFGEMESTFHLWDKRNVVLNFDNLSANGWRIGMRESSDGPIDGNYLVVRGNIAANQRDEGPGAPASSPLAMEYGEVMMPTEAKTSIHCIQTPTETMY